MSPDDLDSVRRSYEAFNHNDIVGWLAHFDPEITWQAAREDPDSALHSGLAGIRGYAEGWIEAYEGLRVEPQELIDNGDQVLVWVRVTGVGRTSGIPLDMEQAQVMTVRGGKVVRTHEYFDRDEALEAIG